MVPPTIRKLEYIIAWPNSKWYLYLKLGYKFLIKYTKCDGIFEISNIFGFLAIVLAAINIFGGFLVTQRMLQMYKKKKKDRKWYRQIYQQCSI